MKKIQVFFMGRKLCQIYPHATRWERVKYNIGKAFRKALIASFLVGTIIGSYKIGVATTEPIKIYAEDISSKMFDSKIEGLKQEVVNKVQKCESAGYKEDDGIIVFDSNAKASLGTLQFQKTTVIHYYKVLYGKTITPKEAVLIALDDTKAEQLAKDIMFTTKNKAGKDWVNCSNKYNIDSQIDIINGLTK